MNARGCPTLSSSPAVGRGASFALAPDRRVGSVLHRRPRVPLTRRRGTFTAGARHAGAEEENGTGTVSQPRVGHMGIGWNRARRRVRAPPGINAASTGAFAFTGIMRAHLGRDDAFHRGLGGPESHPTQPPRFSQKGSERLRESHRWKVSCNRAQLPRCLSGERECTASGWTVFTPNGATDAYRPHPPAIGAE